MKKILFAAALIAAALTTAFAQGGSVTIQNEESVTFYYTVDPPQLPGFSAGSPSAATKIAEFFAAQSSTPQFAPLAPGAQASLPGLPDGAHLLVGFFAVEGQDTFPVRVMTLQADSSMGERFYAIYGSPALLEATRGVGRLAQFTAPAASEQAAPGPATETQPQAAPAAPAAAQAAPGCRANGTRRRGRTPFVVLAQLRPGGFHKGVTGRLLRPAHRKLTFVDPGGDAHHGAERTDRPGDVVSLFDNG